MHVIDTDSDCTNEVTCLRNAGVDVVFRYYARAAQPDYPHKRLTRGEATALSEANISIGICYQYNAQSPDVFSDAMGRSDCKFARDYAAEIVKQPANSAIYFGVDFDPEPTPINELEKYIVPHFQGIAAAMAERSEHPRYDIGVYGAWQVCDRLKRAGLVKYTWLAQASGWGDHAGRAAYLASNAWTISQGFPHGGLCGLDYDPNDIQTGVSSFGQFLVPRG